MVMKRQNPQHRCMIGCAEWKRTGLDRWSELQLVQAEQRT